MDLVWFHGKNACSGPQLDLERSHSFWNPGAEKYRLCLAPTIPDSLDFPALGCGVKFSFSLSKNMYITLHSALVLCSLP